MLMYHVVRRTKRAAAAAAAAVGALVISVGLVATPASAHSLHDAVRSGYGCGWSSGSYNILHSRWITNDSHQRIGLVYLLWHGGLGENCVVTRKMYSTHGISGPTSASLYLQGASSWAIDQGNYSHYAAVSRGAAGVCVKYKGSIGDGTKLHWAGRDELGNCG